MKLLTRKSIYSIQSRPALSGPRTPASGFRLLSHLLLERPPYREAEHRRALDAIREHSPNGANGGIVRGGVREVRSVGDDGRQQSAFETRGIIGPIDAKWRVHHRHQYLKLYSGGSANLL